MAATALRSMSSIFNQIRLRGRVDLSWSGSELRSPSITHGPRGSEFSFSLAPITEGIYGDLSAAQKYSIPVRLVSMRRPLNLVIHRLERIGPEVQVTGRIMLSSPP